MYKNIFLIKTFTLHHKTESVSTLIGIDNSQTIIYIIIHNINSNTLYVLQASF